MTRGVLALGLIVGIFIVAFALLDDCKTQIYNEPPPIAPSCVHSPSALPLTVIGSAAAIVPAIGLILTVKRQSVPPSEASK